MSATSQKENIKDSEEIQQKVVKKEKKSSAPAKSANKRAESKKKESKESTKAYIFKYIKHLVLTEKAIDNINLKNTLVFVVDLKAHKPQIKLEVEKAFNVKVEKVNTLIDRKGRKKAYVKLHPDYAAVDVATQLGMM